MSLINKELIGRINANRPKPKTKEELEKIIYDTMEKEGPDCDLNFIDTSLITNMRYLFPKEFCGNVSYWDVSNVENMEGVFSRCDKFNCDLSQWDVSNVKNMGYMFCYCEKFTGEGLKNWDVINVKNMYKMFYECDKFNCDLSQWKVRNVEDMRYMFFGCRNFEGKDLENWKVVNVKNMDDMFGFCWKVKELPSWYNE